MNKFVVSLLACFWALAAFAQNTTIIVSLDGFRWDYPQLHNTPNLQAMARRGVSAVMRPSYPASTFPNHNTLATGLVPDHHGIVNNTFWDREHHRQFSITDTLTRNNPRYWRSEPIWVTAERQGVRAASLYWPGSDIRGRQPSYFKEWASEPRLNFDERVSQALQWLTLPEAERPRLIMLYIEQPDGAGHSSGPAGAATHTMVEQLDSLMGVLMHGIEKLDIADSVNLIVTSDHGMTDLSPQRFVRAADYLKPQWYHHAAGANPTSLFCSPGYCDSVYNALEGVRGIRVFRKAEIPASLNYGTNPNTGDLIVVPDLGWQFGDTPPAAGTGAHGYDPASADMQVIFFATGPDFKQGFKGTAFDNTAIYSLLAALLNITPCHTDGNVRQIEQLLRGCLNFPAEAGAPLFLMPFAARTEEQWGSIVTRGGWQMGQKEQARARAGNFKQPLR